MKFEKDSIFFSFFKSPIPPFLKGETFFGFLATKVHQFLIFLFDSRLTVFRNEIAMSFNQKTVDLLAMTEL